MPVFVKRVYEKPFRTDGARVLVDRLWPRGLTKRVAAVDAWLKDVAPSHELRRWYHAHRAQWPAFRKKYLAELAAPQAAESLQQLYDFARDSSRLTLVYAGKDPERNNAVVLKQLLEGMRKPPSTSGPKGAAAGAVRAARSQRRR